MSQNPIPVRIVILGYVLRIALLELKTCLVAAVTITKALTTVKLHLKDHRELVKQLKYQYYLTFKLALLWQ